MVEDMDTVATACNKLPALYHIKRRLTYGLDALQKRQHTEQLEREVEERALKAVSIGRSLHQADHSHREEAWGGAADARWYACDDDLDLHLLIGKAAASR